MTTTRGAKQSEPSIIQRTPSPSVRILWLNVAQVRARLSKAVSCLAETHLEIEQVWLFGSLARGDAVPGSDADLLIVLGDCPLPFLDRSVHYQPDFCGVGVDVLAYTREELARMEADGSAFLSQAQREGICLFCRSGSSAEPCPGRG